MPFKVRVQNCQSIKDAELEVSGFTVLTGPNNSGKTAFQRALRGVFTNAPAGSLVRHGEENVVVTVTYDNGDQVTWEKGKKNSYNVNGKSLDRVGRDVPEEVRDLGVKALQTTREPIWPQIATSFPSGPFQGPVFLINKPGALLAEVVSDVERIGTLSKALKACEKDKRSTQSKLALRKEDLKKYEEKSLTFIPFEEWKKTFPTLEEKHRKAQKILTLVEKLRGLHQKRVSLKTQIQSLENLPLVEVAKISFKKVDFLAKKIEELKLLSERRGKLVAQKEHLSSIPTLDLTLEDRLNAATDSLAQYQKYQALQSTYQKAVQKTLQLEETQKTISLPDEESVQELLSIASKIDTLNSLSGRRTQSFSVLEEMQESLNCLDSIPKQACFEDLLEVSQKITQYETLQEKRSALLLEHKLFDTELNTKQQDIKNSLLEYEQLKRDLGTCPTCQTPFERAS